MFISSTGTPLLSIPVKRVKGIHQLREPVSLEFVGHDLLALAGAQASPESPWQYAEEFKCHSLDSLVDGFRVVPAWALNPAAINAEISFNFELFIYGNTVTRRQFRPFPPSARI